MSESIIELFWDCPECGKAGLSGVEHRRCPACFYMRPADVDFYETPDSRVLTATDAARYQTPDWVCKVCGAPNPDRGQAPELLRCQNCDSYQTGYLDLGTDAPERVREGRKVIARTVNADALGYVKPDSQPRARPTRSGKRWLGVAGAAGVVTAGTVVVATGFLGSGSLDVAVTDAGWEVTQTIEQLRPVRAEGWTIPADAYNVSSDRRQRGTRRVQQGFRTVYNTERYQAGTQTETYQNPVRVQTGSREECHTVSNANGTGTRSCQSVPVYETRYETATRQVPYYATRQVPIQVPNMVSVPVYADWYRYEVKRWQQDRTLRSSGQFPEPIQAPSFKLARTPHAERATDPTETCWMTGTFQRHRESVSHTWDMLCEEARRLQRGEDVRVEVRNDRAVLVSSQETLAR